MQLPNNVCKLEATCYYASAGSDFSLRSMATQQRTPASSNSQPPLSDADLEKLLSREASAFQRELEVERILKSFKLKYVATFSNRVK